MEYTDEQKANILRHYESIEEYEKYNENAAIRINRYFIAAFLLYF